jgi:hypothetical protein
MAKKKNKQGLKNIQKSPLSRKVSMRRPPSSLSKEESFWVIESAMDVLKNRRKEKLLGALLDELNTEDF